MGDEGLPKTGDSLFASVGRRDSNADLEFLKTEPITIAYIEAYRKAGDAVVQEFLDTHEWYRDPALFMPAAFMYRHYLELSLKWQIEVGIVWNLYPKEKLNRHGLWELWLEAKPIITTIWPTVNPDTLQGAEDIIRQMHEIDETGQNMRYAVDSKKNRTLEKVPNAVDLNVLREAMTKMWRFFEALEQRSRRWFIHQGWEGFQATMKNRDLK